jgi:hypothetical protein
MIMSFKTFKYPWGPQSLGSQSILEGVKRTAMIQILITSASEKKKKKLEVPQIIFYPNAHSDLSPMQKVTLAQNQLSIR